MNLRAPITLSVLVLVVVFGGWYGWRQFDQPVDNPFAQEPPCESQQVAGTLARKQVLVNVFNASDREDLAATALRDLDRRGFSRGTAANAPAKLRVDTVLVVDPEPGSPQVRLVRAQFKGDVRVRRSGDLAQGVDVVLGRGYSGLLADAPRAVRVRGEREVCVPPGAAAG